MIREALRIGGELFQLNYNEKLRFNQTVNESNSEEYPILMVSFDRTDKRYISDIDGLEESEKVTDENMPPKRIQLV